MHLPYTSHFGEAVGIAAGCVSTALTGLIVSRPLHKRIATILLGASVWVAAFVLVAPTVVNGIHIAPALRTLLILQTSSTLATVSALLSGPRAFAALAAGGQAVLYELATFVRDSDYELAFAHLFFLGLLVGAHALRTDPPSTAAPPIGFRRFRRDDLVIFIVTVALALVVTNFVFGRLTFNGDEIANSFQADVYGHFRAYAPVPPCPSMFENYWVFRYQGRVFSQYTPGWPLFMAPFQRLHVIWLAGPVMAGITAVGIARLSRRMVLGLGATSESELRLERTAGALGAMFAMLGPSMLLNGGSRFSHTMVCACFAWALESLAVLSQGGTSPRTDGWYGLVLGASTSLGVATRPADGSMLGVGVFLYFVWALSRRKLSVIAFVGTAAGFAICGGLVATILRLQLGAWFQTGYSIVGLIHPEGALRLSWPRPNEIKYAIPLATGSYCWWPAAPALGIAGLVRSLGGRERRVAFMMVMSTLAIIGFYFFVEFGRGGDDGLGPRYILGVVVVMAAGGAGILAPLVEAFRRRHVAFERRWRTIGPTLLVGSAIAFGVVLIAPLMYLVAYSEYRYATTALRLARQLKLKNAIVTITPGHTTEYNEMNLSQNAPMDPNPDVLFLVVRSDADVACAREHFPGRTWYRSGCGEVLEPY